MRTLASTRFSFSSTTGDDKARHREDVEVLQRAQRQAESREQKEGCQQSQHQAVVRDPAPRLRRALGLVGDLGDPARRDGCVEDRARSIEEGDSLLVPIEGGDRAAGDVMSLEEHADVVVGERDSGRLRLRDRVVVTPLGPQHREGGQREREDDHRGEQRRAQADHGF